MADIHDVMHADQDVQNALEEIKDEQMFHAVAAICYAIQAIGVRLDYVISEASRRG